MVQCVGVLVLAVVGVLGAAWAAQPDVEGVEGQVSSGPSAEAATADAGPEPMESGQGGGVEEMLKACQSKTCSFASSTFSFIKLPGCLAKLLDPCAHGDGEISLAIFAIFFAVLTRQTVIGYRQDWRLSFALFLILFLGTTVLNIFVLTDPWFDFLKATIVGEFAMIFLVSAFFAGVLAFWARYLLDLLAVVASASFVALLPIELPSVQMPLIVATGIAGGVWLHWWRDHRKKRKTTSGGGQTPTDGGGGNPGFG